MWRKGARRWRKNNRISSLLISARRNAKARNLIFNLEISDFSEIPSICPVLKIPIFPNEKGRSDNSPSLDRINNKLGYIKGNVRIISYKANRLKSDMSIEECKLILKDLESV
jgi:hypothetical protein